MKKNKEKPGIPALDKELIILSSSRFRPVQEYDELLAFTPKTNWGWALLIPAGLSLVFYSLGGSFLPLFLFNMLLALITFLWNYRYNLRKQPVIRLNREQIIYKRHSYPWNEVYNLICVEGYDEERSTCDSIYIRFNYRNSIKTIYINGLSAEEIIHYIHAFRANKG